MAKEIKDICETFSISFNKQSTKNHIYILGVIIYWITLKFKRKSIVIKFVELIAGKLGKAIANIFFDSISSDFKREIETIINNIIITIIEERIGLDYREKLFIIYRDNTSNNNIFCDYLYNLLLYDYDDDPILNTGLPKCHFYGRPSRIRCIAYLIALVVSVVLKQLKSGTYAEALALVAQINDGDGTFDSVTCSALSVYIKVRTFVLQVIADEAQRITQKKVYIIMLLYDVNSRWNSLYLMMFKAQEHKASIVKFTRLNPEV